MSHYECSRIQDAAGYVLRALPEGEWESYRYHIDECQDCATQVTELGFVSHALLSAVPQLSAPPDIRNRVMSVVRAESELLLAAGAGADRSPSHRQRDRGFGLGRLRPLTVGALATVLIALGLGVGTFLNGGFGTSCKTIPGTVSVGTAAKADLKVCGSDATLALKRMPVPPKGRGYQPWLDDPNDRQGPKPVANGVFSVRDGHVSFDVGKLKPGTTVLVTDEPYPGGSEVPTRRPVVKVVT